MNTTTDRRYLLERSDKYLFSYDIPLEMRRGGAGWNLSLERPARWPAQLLPPGDGGAAIRNDATVFHLRGDTVLGERDALWGQVCWLTESLRFNSQGDTGVSRGRMTIAGFEGAMIDAVFSGVYRLQELGQRRLMENQPLEHHLEVKLFTSLRFETGHAKFKWLTQMACAGFGTARIQGGGPELQTFTVPINMDIYGLS